MSDPSAPNGSQKTSRDGRSEPGRDSDAAGPASPEADPQRKAGPWGLLKKTIRNFLEDDVIHWGASLAYYSLISLAPLVLLAMTIFGKVIGTGEAEDWILEQVQLLAGPRGMELAQTVLEQASQPELGSVGAILTIALLLFGATAMFANLQGALNRIWGVRAGSGVIRNILRTRVVAFLMVLALGGILIFSVVVSTVMSWIAPLLDPLEAALPAFRIAEPFTSILLLWVFVTAAFQILPDVKIHWRDVWVGALATAVVLYGGKYALSAFLARNAFASMYGTAGSLFLVLMWIYFSAQVFFLGAEFTQVWARRQGRRIQPQSYAVPLEKVGNDTGD
jgi:membrane protein